MMQFHPNDLAHVNIDTLAASQLMEYAHEPYLLLEKSFQFGGNECETNWALLTLTFTMCFLYTYILYLKTKHYKIYS